MNEASKPGRIEGIIAIAQPVNADRPPQVVLKLIRQSGEREITAQEIQLTMREAGQLAQFLCALARNTPTRPRHRRRRLKS